MQPSQAEPAKKQLGYDSLSSCSCLESSPGRLKTWRRSRAPACSWQKVVLQRCWTHCLIIILSSSKLKRGTSSSSIIAELLAWFALPDLSFSWNISCCFGCSLCSLTSRENLIWPATCWHCLFPWSLGLPESSCDKLSQLCTEKITGQPCIIWWTNWFCKFWGRLPILPIETSVAQMTDV